MSTHDSFALSAYHIYNRHPIHLVLSATSVGVVQIATVGMHCVALTYDNRILTSRGDDLYEVHDAQTPSQDCRPRVHCRGSGQSAVLASNLRSVSVLVIDLDHDCVADFPSDVLDSN